MKLKIQDRSMNMRYKMIEIERPLDLNMLISAGRHMGQENQFRYFCRLSQPGCLLYVEANSATMHHN